MNIGMLLKIFSDCCVCFAILGAFPSVITYSYPLLYPALLCGIAAGVAAFLSEKQKPVLSRLCAVIPFASLFLVGEAGEVIILLPVLIYVTVVILRGKLQLEYYSYRQFFLRSLILLGALFAALSIFSFLETFAGDVEPIIQASVTLRYGIVHLFCGIILQRQLRLGMERRGQGGAGQIVAMLGGTGVVIAGFLVAEPALRTGAAAIFKAIIGVIFGGIMAVLELFTSALDQIELDTMREQVEQARGDRNPTISSTLGDQIQQVTQSEDTGRSLWWVVLIVAVLIIAMALMFLTFRKKSAEVHSEEMVTTVRVPEKAKTSRYSNRSKVRQVYREFLRQEKKRGLLLKKDYTSSDILQRVSEDTDEAAAAQLREIYLQARYNENCEISRDQVDAAKAALKKSRGGANASA